MATTTKKPAKTINVIFIDPKNREVSAHDVLNTLKTMQSIVNGSIEMVCSFSKNDVIYANANGLFQKPHYWWSLRDRPIVFTGPAVVVKVDRHGNFNSPTITWDEVTSKVEFLSQPEARERWEVCQEHRREHARQMLLKSKPDGGFKVFFSESEFPG